MSKADARSTFQPFVPWNTIHGSPFRVAFARACFFAASNVLIHIALLLLLRQSARDEELLHVEMRVLSGKQEDERFGGLDSARIVHGFLLKTPDTVVRTDEIVKTFF